jgi:predicted DNA-binding transcriptional regulator YafY
LKNDFGCPIKYKRSIPGYYLSKPGWKFVCPTDLSEPAMLTMIIGAKVVEDIFPPPLNTQVKSAVDEILKGNNPDFLDTANMDSLRILSGLSADIAPDIFMTVFQAWQEHRRLKISYADWQGGATERMIEPHTLVFYNNSWYTKAFCRLKEQPRTFALQRIKHAELLHGKFDPDKEIISSVNPDDFLGFEKIRNVKLKAENYALDKLKNSPLHSSQVIHSDGTVEIPAIAREVLFPFIFSHGGNIKLLEPAGLKSELREKLLKMLSDC